MPTNLPTNIGYYTYALFPTPWHVAGFVLTLVGLTLGIYGVAQWAATRHRWRTWLAFYEPARTQRLAAATQYATGKPVHVVQRMSGRTGRIWIASQTTVTPAETLNADVAEQPTLTLPPVITQSYPRVELSPSPQSLPQRLPADWSEEFGLTFDAYAGGGSHLPVPSLPPRPALSEEAEEEGLERTRRYVFAEEDAAAWTPFCLACGAPMPCLAHLSWQLARERRLQADALDLVLPSLWEHLERAVVPFVNQN